MTSRAMRLLGQRFLLRRVHAAGSITSLQARWSTARPQDKAESQDMFNGKSFTEPLTGGVNKAWYIAPRSCSGRAFSVVAEPIKTSNTEKCFDIETEGAEKFLVANRELNTGEVLFDGGGGEFTTYRTRHSIQVGHGKHVTVDDESDLMDHSCTPNCMMEVVDGENGHVSQRLPFLGDCVQNVPSSSITYLRLNCLRGVVFPMSWLVQ